MEIKYVLFGLILSISLKYVTSSFCYWNTGCQYKYFSSKTPYNAVRGDIRDSLIKIKDCKPVSIWGLYRHGKKYPGAEDGLKMKEAVVIRDFIATSYENGNCSLCAQDIDNLRDWIQDKKLFGQVHELADEGTKEVKAVGERLKQAFPKLFNNLDAKSVIIQAADEPWIKESAKLFVENLNDKIAQSKEYINFENNYIVAPYSTCGKYQKDVKENPDTYAEVNKYTRTPEFLVVKDRIQRRLGIDYILTNDNITALYDLCRYTWTSIENKISPWCALFTTEDLQVLEYFGDLKNYYESGYGYSMSDKFGKFTLSDLLQKFEEAKKFESRKLVAYFTHSATLNMVYTALDIFKDDAPLTATNRVKDRKWRNSVITAFAANLVAVLNRCNGGDDYNVVFYLNEEPLRSICSGGICSWQEFEEKLTPFLNTKMDICGFETKPLF